MNRNFIIFLTITILFLACSKAPERAKGPLDVVYVLADDSTWSRLEKSIDTCFSEYGIRTPEFQPFFSVKWMSIKKLKIFAYNRNLMVLADLSEKGLASDLARKILPAEHLDLARQDSVNIFSINDHFARDQLFIMVAGTDMQKLAQTIIERKDNIFAKFNKKYQERAKEMLYSSREKKSLSRVFWDKYKWGVRIPKKFIPIKEAPDSNFVWLGAALPYRWFSVSWEEGMNTRWMTANGMMEKRQEIGAFYDGIKADTTFISHYYTKLGQWDALKMTGIWFSEVEAKGGPFLSYAFYDSHSDRTFLLDMLIFDPSEKLTDYFRQMEIMANTFYTEYSPDVFK